MYAFSCKPDYFFFKYRIDLLVIQKLNLALEKLSIRTSMSDTSKQYRYTFQMVPKSRRHLKVSVSQMTPSRSIMIEPKQHCAKCIRRTIQGIGFVQPREENTHRESNHSFPMPRGLLQRKRGHSFHKDAQQLNKRQQAQVASGKFCPDTGKKNALLGEKIKRWNRLAGKAVESLSH